MFENGIIMWRAAVGKKRASVVFGGDVCPRGAGEDEVRDGRASEIFKEVAPFVRSADAGVVQWETPCASKPDPIDKSGPNLNCSASTIEAVGAAGFTIALLANNHVGDHGPAAVLETRDAIKRAGLRTVGAGVDLQEAVSSLFFEAGEIRVALFNFAENEFGIAGKHTPGVAPLDPLRNLRAVREANASGYLVLVALHGGHENNPFPSPRMQELFRAFADAGAAAVFNCHTHCPEGIEIYKDVPIINSPGNLYFPPRYAGVLPVWRLGFLAKFLLDEAGAYALELLPYAFTDTRVQILKGAKKTAFFEYLEELSRPLNDPDQVQALFETWSSRSAKSYLAANVSQPAGWQDELHNPATVRNILGLRNQFICESHCDQAKCFFRLTEENRLDEAEKNLSYIDSLQRPAWLIK
ncbi:MAG: CapA family protein [Victivallaceae bacterium]|nr:CapA family protein [Victivallaceae bacterium]